ncbi:hypothetical protein T439DRAFT_326968 [Meredithblackwellia eburnea MCA 4105]
MPSTAPKKADVLIVGGGPVGSLIGYQLLRNGCKPFIIDQDDKKNAPIYGRACTLWPRALELFDQLGLGDDLLSLGVASKTGINFKDGVAHQGGLVFGHRMDRNGDTNWNFSLHLRQRHTERVIEAAINELDHEIHGLTRLEGWKEDEQAEYPITCTLRDLQTDQVFEVQTKFVVGADGGKSFVRKSAGINFIGEHSGAEWIRMDALVETDMPSPRALNSVMSASHGLVLFCPIDEGRTRIGYVWNEELQKKYGPGGATLEVAKEEAKKALHPFKLEFKAVDWFTLYGIGQRIASTFMKGRIILAGDACHTHSSGSAQGLNTGTFDAVNLAWKLSLHLRGLAPIELVQSYDEERKAKVQQVIDNDLIIATLISGKLPPKFHGRKESPRDILTEWFENASTVAFTLGIGISYPPSNYVNLSSAGSLPITTIQAGDRSPDVKVSRIATNEQVRFQKLIPNNGRFNIVIFTGNPTLTLPALKMLEAGFTQLKSRFPAKKLFSFLTIISGEGIGAAEYLGTKPVGTAYFDPFRGAHEVYGIDPTRGAIVVFRPDGYVGRVVQLTDVITLGEYFARFLIEGAGDICC